MNNTEITTLTETLVTALVETLDDDSAKRLFSALYGKLSSSIVDEDSIADNVSMMVNEDVTEERVEEIAQEIINGDEIHVQAGEFLVSVIDTAFDESGYFLFEGLGEMQDGLFKKAIGPEELDGDEELDD